MVTKADRFRDYYLRKGLTPYAVRRFRRIVREHYRASGRDLPWRKTRDPYRILVSEIMLQQTQVDRVKPAYVRFLKAFPDVRALAKAPVKRLLRVWQGMGYNRRALALKRAAQTVVRDHGGRVPATIEELTALPGIGPATAADIVVFAYNRPALVVETNIRSVYIHLFFAPGRAVKDDEIVSLIERTMDRRNPRDWYNALMDFGAALKKSHVNPSRRSAAYRRQSPFEGSNRQARSRILRYLLEEGPRTPRLIVRDLGLDEVRTKKNLKQMAEEGLIRRSKTRYRV